MQSFLAVSTVLLWGVVLFNLLLTLALVRRVNTQRKTAEESVSEVIKYDLLKPGEAAPEFVATTLDGNEVTLAKYLGRIVMFVFISSGCAPCHEMVPEVQKMSSKARAKGIELVFVSQNDLLTTQNFLKKFSSNDVPVLIAPKAGNRFLLDYKVPGTPFLYLIDVQGLVQDYGFIEKWHALASQW